MQRICKKHLVGQSRATYYLPMVALALVVGMAARAEAQPVAPAALSGEAGFSKDRYVSIDPTTNGTENAAIRVTRVGSLTDKFVDCTSLENKGADGFYAALIDGPLPAPGDANYYCDWSTVTTGLHIRGCSVVPGNDYNVSMTIDGSMFSTALSIPTTPPQWPARAFGDTVGGLVAGTWTAPDGLVTTNDIVAAVKKFGLDPQAPIMARVDTDGAVPNAVISSGDILRAVRGFAGDLFGSGVMDCKLGQCIPPIGCGVGGGNPPGNSRLDLVPIGSTGTVTSLVGNSIEIPAGGVVIELEARVSEWATTGDGLIQSIQATIDGSGYCSGSGDNLSPLGYPGTPIVSCPQGSGCPADGSTCSDGAFVITKRCTVGFASPPTGAACSVGGDCPGEFCLDDTAYLFSGFDPLSPIAFPGLNYEIAGLSQLGGKNDGGLVEYFGTILVEIPAGAVGTYNINYSLDTERTFNGDGAALSFAISNLNGATITITSGSCCFNIGPGTTQCIDDVTASTCAGQVAPTAFRVGELCPPAGSDCTSCQSDIDCDDGIACTDDACVNPNCVFTPNDANCPDDGAFCNGTEFCSVQDCQSTGDPCLAGENCNEATDTCDVGPTPTGACCLADNGCLVTTLDDCLTRDGAYGGDGTTCGGIGACCLGDGSCALADGTCCVSQLIGSPQGFATACAPDEACCTEDGGCTDTSPVCCINERGGAPQGAGTICAGLDGDGDGFDDACPSLLVGCCMGSGLCVEETAFLCAIDGGTQKCGCVGDLDIDGTDDVCEACANLIINPPLLVGGLNAPLNRYLSYDPGNPDGCIAYQVELTSSNMFPGCSGVKKWVGEPDQTTGIALLQDTPLYRKWIESVVHVTGADVVPATTYEVRGVHEACDPPGLSDFSSALVLTTTPKPGIRDWGDVVGSFDGSSWTPPNGQVNFNDIKAVIERFRQDATAPPLVWVDLRELVPDRAVDILDVDAVIRSFGGQPYPESSPCAARRAGTRAACVPPADTAFSFSPPDKPAFTLPPEEPAVTVVVIPGEQVEVEILLDETTDVHLYQITVELKEQDVVDGLDVWNATGEISLVDIRVDQKLCTAARTPCISNLNCVSPETCDENGRYIFHDLGPAFAEINLGELRVLAEPNSGGSVVVTATNPYLATFVLKVDNAASVGGRLGVSIITDDNASGSRLRDLADNTICFGVDPSPPPSFVLVVEGDCNTNGIADTCDVDCTAPGCELPNCETSTDCDGNQVPDECQIDQDDSFAGNVYLCDSTLTTCESDCNQNGTMDRCDIDQNSTAPGGPFFCDSGTTTCATDCNNNGVPDECDLADATSSDCNSNMTPDECEIDPAGGAAGGPYFCDPITTTCDPDCNTNGNPDACDITSDDGGFCDDMVDVCQKDCQTDGIPDSCQLSGNDCQPDLIPDECQLAGNDCQPDMVPDECQLAGNDCQPDMVPDECQLTGNDCQPNSIPDECDIDPVTGTSCNENGDALPDECQLDCGVCACAVCDGFPTSGIDEFTTTAAFSVIFLEDSVVTSFEGFSEVTNTVVGRSDPILDTIGEAETGIVVAGGGAVPYPDTAATVNDPCVFPVFGFERNGGDNHEVQAEMLTMSLTDGANTFKVGQAFYTALVDKTQYNDSIGEFHGQCIDFPAKGFFDLFFELDVNGMKLHNLTPLVVVGTADSFPDGGAPVPWAFSKDFNLPPVVLVDEKGIQRAYLVGAEFGSSVSFSACNADRTVADAVSFAVEAGTLGLENPPSITNHVQDDSNLSKQDITVYMSPTNVPPQAQTPPDLMNIRVVALVGDTGTAMPFLNADRISSLSFGRDGTLHPGGLNAPAALYFSVDDVSVGVECSGIVQSSDVNITRHPGDVFTASIPAFGDFVDALPLAPPCNAARGNCLTLDHTALGLAPPPTGAIPSELTALELGAFDEAVGDLAYITIKSTGAATDQATIFTFNGVAPFDRGALLVFADAASMGLQPSDVIDALAVSDTGILGTVDGTDSVLFSLARDTCIPPACSPADIFISAFDGTFTIHAAHDAIGLLETDNVDAIDVGSSLKLATDCNANGISDLCDAQRGLECPPVVPPNALTGELGFTKDRYISFAPNTNGTTQIAYRVTRVGSTTPRYVSCTGRKPIPPDGPFVGVDGVTTSLVSTQEFCSWDGLSAIHVHGCNIVPDNDYTVDATQNGVDFSSAITLQTSRTVTTGPDLPFRFGDTVGPKVNNKWTAPDGVVSVQDISAAVLKFQNPLTTPHSVRIDTDGAAPGADVNGLVTASDVSRAVNAFNGKPFGNGVTGCETGNCVPNCP